jgi:hypothetical protein
MENKQNIPIHGKGAGPFRIVWGSAIPSFFVALIWAGDFTSQFPNSDSTGLAQFILPFLYAFAFVVLFFLVWPPFFGAILGIFTTFRFAPYFCGKKVWVIWFLSLLPFCFSLWFFLKAPTMAKYRIFHL